MSLDGVTTGGSPLPGASPESGACSLRGSIYEAVLRCSISD